MPSTTPSAPVTSTSSGDVRGRTAMQARPDLRRKPEIPGAIHPVTIKLNGFAEARVDCRAPNTHGCQMAPENLSTLGQTIAPLTCEQGRVSAAHRSGLLRGVWAEPPRIPIDVHTGRGALRRSPGPPPVTPARACPATAAACRPWLSGAVSPCGGLLPRSQ